MRRVAGIKEWVEEYDAVVKEVEDLRLMPEFVKEGVVTEQELDEQYARAMHRIEELELRFHQEELFAAWEKAMEEQEQYEQGAAEE